jgi:hypothetical protein
MALDKQNGEHLEGLGRGKPVPPGKWAHFMDAAAEAARHHFEAAGARKNLQFDPSQILVQEFWLHSKIVITFCVPVDGEDRFYNYTLDLSPGAVAELSLTGHWPATYADLPNLRAN